MSELCSEDTMDESTQGLCPQEIQLDLDVPDRREALQAVSAMVARARTVSAPPVFRALWRREQAGSTGMGNAFAIPHARITGITEPVTAYVRLKTPLDFAAPDRKRVSELFVILLPAEGADEAHLQLLALVAEAFADGAFRARLASASDPQDVRSTFSLWIAARNRVAREEH
jgi:PTS system nitrogen regulatory IIA component